MTHETFSLEDGSSRWLLAGGVVAGPLFLLMIAIQAVTRTGFDITRHPASLLSVGESGWIQIANFIAAGLLVIAFAFGAKRALRPGRAATTASILLFVYGLGLLIAGIFPPDPAFGFPPGAPDGVPASVSASAALHGIGFTVAFLAVTIAALVVALRDAREGRWAWAAYGLLTAITSVVLSQWPSLDGASVRYLVAAGIAWTWLTATALRCLSATAKAVRVGAPGGASRGAPS